MQRNCIHAALGRLKVHSSVTPGLIRFASTVSTSSDTTPTAPSKSRRTVFGSDKRNARRKQPPVDPQDEKLPGEWEPTPGKGLDTKPLKRLLLQPRPSADPAVEALGASYGEDIPTSIVDADWIEMSFAPGTLVETRKNETCVIGVVLSEVIDDQRWAVLSVSMQGEVFKHLRHDVQFAIPGFISSDLASRCGTEPVTDDPKCVNARVQVLKRLKLFNMDVESAYNAGDWARQRNINIYHETRSIDPTRWSKTTVKHITHLTWQQPKYHHFYAVHRHMMENSLKFVASHDCLASQTFHVRPLRDVNEVETVRKWISEFKRDEDGPFVRFIHKAKNVIAGYRSKENKSGPVSQQPTEHAWDEDDQCFLRFLLRSLVPWRTVQTDPYGVFKVNLIKSLYPKVNNVSDVSVLQCLKELRVIAPWHDPFETTHFANPTGDFYNPNPYNEESEAIAKRTFQNKAVAGTVLGPEDLHPVDPLDSVRHDFGNLNVFVVDDANAEELDDGISLERIPSEKDKYWVHAHIADPASLLHPGHVLSLRARDRGCTLYFKQKTFPLFPRSLVHDSIQGLSLGTRSSTGLGDRTITFSVKLDTEGNILDHKIQAGIVRNVRTVTYDQYDKLLGLKPMLKLYPFGRQSKDVQVSPAKFTEDETKDLKLLYQLAQTQVKRRFDNGIFTLDLDGASVEMGQISDGIQSPSMGGSIFSGYPKMEYSVTNSENQDTGSRMTVSEIMKLASRVASRVALEHGIPLIRRALDPMVPSSDEKWEEMLQARSPNGYIPMAKFLNHMAVRAMSAYTLEPRRHSGLGVPDGEGYSRSTSPLRRFEDLVVHWQLHHVLLGSKAPPNFPFSLSEMEGLCVDIASTDKMSRKLQVADGVFHSMSFLKRWMETSEKGRLRAERNPLSRKFTAFKTGSVKKNLLNNSYECAVTIPKLGIRAHMINLTRPYFDLPLSSEVQVKVKSIDLGVNRIGMKVVLT